MEDKTIAYTGKCDRFCWCVGDRLACAQMEEIALLVTPGKEKLQPTYESYTQ